MKKTTLFSAAALCLAMAFQTQLNAQLVCHLTFDNGSTQDFSGNNAHATNNGCTFVTDRFGNPNSALHVDNQAWLQGPSTNFPLSNSPRTISAWVEMDINNMSNAGVIFGYGGCNPNGSGYGLMLAKSCGGGYCGLKIFSFGYGHDLTIPYTAALNSWVHIAAAYDGNTVKIYVDGIYKGSATRTWNTVPSAGIYAVGNSTPYSAPYNNCQALQNFFIGNIDDIRLYNEELSAQEILALYNMQSTVGINELKNEDISLYPNPANNFIKINGIETIQSVSITDITGKLVKEIKAEEIIDNTILLDENMNSGIYFISLKDENGLVSTKKFSKIK